MLFIVVSMLVYVRSRAQKFPQGTDPQIWQPRTPFSCECVSVVVGLFQIPKTATMAVLFIPDFEVVDRPSMSIHPSLFRPST